MMPRESYYYLNYFDIDTGKEIVVLQQAETVPRKDETVVLYTNPRTDGGVDVMPSKKYQVVEVRHRMFGLGAYQGASAPDIIVRLLRDYLEEEK